MIPEQRYRELMEHIGMPHSRSLYEALKQVENEASQELAGRYNERERELVESLKATSAAFDLALSHPLRHLFGKARAQACQALCQARVILKKPQVGWW